MLFRLFIDGGIFWTSLLTIELIGLLLAAWKAPAWVKEVGIIAFATGLLGTLIGMSQMCGAISQHGEIAMSIIAGGLQVSMITVIYGCLIFIASLLIRIIQKPRLL